MNISIPTGGENPPTKESPKGKNPSTRELTQIEERANLESPGKEIEETNHSTEPHKIPTIEVHPTKTASKAKHQEAQKQTKRVT